MDIKKIIADYAWKHSRKYLEDRFVQDMFGDVPHELTEGAMKFLLSGGTQFDRWIRLNSYVLQRKLSSASKETGFAATGGLVFFKTLMTLMARVQAGEKVTGIEDQDNPSAPPVSLEDSMRGVDTFFGRKKVGS